MESKGIETPLQAANTVERGAGTLLSMGLILALSVMMFLVCAFIKASGARALAENAADMGAIAAAQDMFGRGGAQATALTACKRAAEVVQQNQAELVSCRLIWTDPAQVEVVAKRSLLFGDASGRARATARSGQK